MLYDKRWDQTETKPDVSLESLIAWLETMPGDATYNYFNCFGKCLYGQYVTAHGIAWQDSGHFAKTKEENETPAAKFCMEVYTDVACTGPFTFGAALTRARALASRGT